MCASDTMQFRHQNSAPSGQDTGLALEISEVKATLRQSMAILLACGAVTMPSEGCSADEIVSLMIGCRHGATTLSRKMRILKAISGNSPQDMWF